jgi:hypothetical protein
VISLELRNIPVLPLVTPSSEPRFKPNKSTASQLDCQSDLGAAHDDRTRNREVTPMKRVAPGQRTEQKLSGGLRTSSSFAKASGGRRSSHGSPSEAGGTTLVLAALADTSEGTRVAPMKRSIEERLKQMAVDACSTPHKPTSKKPARRVSNSKGYRRPMSHEKDGLAPSPR